MKVGLAVPVQMMIDSEYSGIMFTIDPVSEDPNKLSIEAGYGFGEAIVSGSITPDRYVVDKEKIEIMDKEINDQPWKIIKAGREGAKHVDVLSEKRKAQKLTDDQIIELAKIGLLIEKHYGKPQDTEFAIEKGKIYMVQSRPITTLGKQGNKVSVPEEAKVEGAPEVSPDKGDIETDKAEVILKGAAASLGIAFGPVKLIHKPDEIDKVMQGDVLVTEQTTPDFVPAMRRAKAIVTDTGGRTCHAAIVSRELGIPCVVGAGTATHVLKTGQMITVDGAKGLVYKGKVKSAATAEEVAQATGTPGSKILTEEVPITGTKVYVNLAEPHLAEKIAAEPVDGVGLLRAEFMIAEIGEHPRAMVEDGRAKEYVDKLSEGMRTIAQAFAPRPVVYRATDFKTNEYKGLKGGEKYEPVEANPMIGYRGASRYIKEPDLFKLELDAMKRVRDEYDLKNLWLMIPFVRTVE
jgi:pyruvate,water dikinase